MQYLQLHPGDSALIEIDANQTSQSPISLNDGPIESFLWNEQLGWLPPTTGTTARSLRTLSPSRSARSPVLVRGR
jgi:hypothetical protein